VLSLSDESVRPKQYKAGMADKRMTGRPSFQSNSSSRLSLVSQSSVDEPIPASEVSTPKLVEGEKKDGHRVHGHHKHHQPHTHHHDKLLSQVAQWLQAEKAKRAARKSKKNEDEQGLDPESRTHKPRTSSQSSDSSALSLEQLQRILEENMGALGHEQLPFESPVLKPRRPSYVSSKRRPSAKKLGAGSSDTEYQDGDVLVPTCDVVLDNSMTMSYSGGAADSSSTTVTLSTSKRAEKERKAWSTFKCEIVRLAHTLRLKGWRRVPLERGGDIEVERLSGALTNAVYVVSPPKDLPSPESVNGDSKSHTHSPPPRLLLRIYGPQVEHLIDRENELSILRRLSRKKIGPRLLGTFRNGRFEEFYNAQTLTAEDLRVEDTSKQIAKRMRELHDGVELLEREREEGPFVWRNWDKWVDRCEEVISYLDKEILSGKKGSRGESWRGRGFVCGVEWPKFRAVIDKYRKWLEEYYGEAGIHRHLVFAHNDVSMSTTCVQRP
jgi:choline kinase